MSQPFVERIAGTRIDEKKKVSGWVVETRNQKSSEVQKQKAILEKVSIRTLP